MNRVVVATCLAVMLGLASHPAAQSPAGPTDPTVAQTFEVASIKLNKARRGPLTSLEAAVYDLPMAVMPHVGEYLGEAQLSFEAVVAALLGLQLICPQTALESRPHED